MISSGQKKQSELLMDQLNFDSFMVARKEFERHLGVGACLQRAIIAFRREEMKRLHKEHAALGLDISVADSDAGSDTALVITGFKNIQEITTFVAEKLK